MKRKKNYKRGAAIMTAVLFFLLISTTIVLGVGGPVYEEVKFSRNILDSKESFFLSESGQEDVIYRLKNGMNVSQFEDLTIGSSTVRTTVVDDSGFKIILSSATSSDLVRKVQTRLILGEGFSFNYGVQVGDGGLYMKNSSSVSGNVFSSGPITAVNTPIINGDAISSGVNGLIEDMEITGNAYAHTIIDSEIGGDAHYQVISGSSVLGTMYPNSPDQATSSLPIPYSKIEEWKTEASAGGTSTNCTITTSQTIGPKKYNCSTLTIQNTPTITLAGPIWVSGNLEVSNSVVLQISGSLGQNSVAIIADNESNRLTSSKIKITNSATFLGPNNNYILLVSMNNSAENGGGEEAIELKNSATGDVLVYAPYGEINLENNINITEVTGYKVSVENNAEIIYESGLVNLLFSSGPSGGYSLDSWLEVP